MVRIFKSVRESALTALWFMFLTFPIMVIKINPVDETVGWRWMNLLYTGLGSFIFSWLWRFFLERRAEAGSRAARAEDEGPRRRFGMLFLTREALKQRKLALRVLSGMGIAVIAFPFLVNSYQVTIITSALIFVILGLGLNIVIGYGGLLHLGYAAFYAAGAYNYGLLYLYTGMGFWAALPLGALSGMVFGLLIGFPVLRLRGDYLAIVTLALGQIVRLLLENLSGFTKGPEGIAQIPRPKFFTDLSYGGAVIYLYFIVLAGVILTIFVIRRIEDSRIGRALEAMRDDEIAAQAMGIDLTRVKLITFSMGALWAGLAGVFLAGKTAYINPGSFTLLESVMILVAVVLGGTGSIPGVVLGALLVTLIPEYFRALSDYRMLMFGAALVLMPIFRPQGIIPRVRRRCRVSGEGRR